MFPHLPMISPQVSFVFSGSCVRFGPRSCFFHAIVTSLSKSYRDTEVYTEKIDKVKSIRSTIGSKIDSSNWEGLQNGEPCQFKFLEHLRILETELVKFIKKPQRYMGRKDRAWIHIGAVNRNGKLVANCISR